HEFVTHGENRKCSKEKILRRLQPEPARLRPRRLQMPEEDDACWQETDKQRKDDKEKRRQELLKRKKENQRLLEEESSKIRGKSQKENGSGGKVTLAQIEETLQNDHLETPLEENINRIVPEEGTVEVRSIEDAIAVLSTGPEDLDRHPERRMKSAFAAYDEENMPRLKQENPNMRLSQLKQQLKKEWAKSPENPLNQRFTSYNSK
uniref:HMG box domain-containing protein n=1 Tax=Oryzias latipes TaxID=8090 RepID=H2MLV9_ORYLA